MRHWVLLLVVLTALGPVGLAQAEAKPEPKKDKPDIEYVEDDPADEQPANPFGERNTDRPDAVAGKLTLSNDRELTGLLTLTRNKKLHFTHREKKKRLFFDLAEIETIACRVIVERMEPEWRWKENANDEKVYTGRHYPVRELETVLCLKDGRELVGDCTALVYLHTENGASRFIIHKRQKGKVGQKLEDLVYVKLVDFRKPPEQPEKKKKE